MKYDKFSIVISPFGTSSIEVLLFEIFSTYQIEKIVLAGLCKRFNKSEAETGTIYAVNKAYIASTGLDEEVKFPVTYKFEIRGSVPFMNAVSTDFYYGFNEEPNTIRNKLLLLQKKYKSFSKKVELVDFDTAQFYAICRMYAENKIFEYVSLKAVSQSIDAFQDQIKNPASLLDSLFAKSLEQIDVKKLT
ncbi:hypothetical protein CHS0354_000707 [Potamilus streckersoni]|uniref:Nucleoside phosphorylase domain-containing protein n=1 Tax=Potamilus streckersoni TaxID=2493646 RepID=A0AAE0W862_9BIVA|nr:hypothetical protein CHS0354_000707 [Potamilus streckersoni]